MSDERWVVIHASARGCIKHWYVNAAVAKELIEFARPASGDKSLSIGFDTISGRALIWFTPGQSLTVEKAS